MVYPMTMQLTQRSYAFARMKFFVPKILRTYAGFEKLTSCYCATSDDVWLAQP